MVFTLYIRLKIPLDEETGLPIVWLQIPFGDDMESHTNYVVPKEYRKYLHQTGDHFQRYVKGLRNHVVDVDVFLRQFPGWISETNQWTKQQHDEFHKALEWFAAKDAFILEWVY